MAITDHGAPVISARVMTTALVPNAAGNGWNFIADTAAGGTNPQEWTVLKNFTTTPVQATYTTPTHHYPNTNYQYTNQLRAQNGRIFFPSEDLYVSVYDMTTEQVTQIGPLVESPPVLPTVSTQPFSAVFDVGGQLYMATQESGHRPSCLSVLDPVALTWNVVSYFGTGANTYTTYGYYTAPDTGTAIKTVYAVYGEDPWQLWSIDVTIGGTYGTATLMTFPGGGNAQVPATGSISFSNVAGQGWVGHFNTDIGHPDNVTADYWLNDGVMVLKTNNVNPSPRNVTPASAPLVSPPQIDLSPGAGLLNWRPNGSSGDYTQVPYTINYASPVTIESLVTATDGIVGNAQQYNGVFQYYEPLDNHSWYGSWSNGISEPVDILVGGHIYLAGYPNGVLYDYDLSKPWAAFSGTPNPKNLGNYGLTGTQFAGIKYARAVAWSAATGRLYCAGDRDRNGTGMGVGYCIIAGPTFAGVYSSADGSTGPAQMSSLLTAGIAVDDTHSLVAVSTKTISGSGNAPIIVFNQALNSSTIYAPFPGVSALGPIVASGVAGVVAGAFVANGLVNLYRFNIQTGQIVQSVVTEIAGPINAFTTNQNDGSMWLAVGATLLGVSANSLFTKTVDISSVAPVSCLAVYGTDMYMSSTATLYSSPIPSTSFTVPFIDPAILFPSGVIGRALGVPDFFDLLISTLNEMATQLAVTTLDANLLRATAAAGRAQGIPTFYGTILSTVNACAAALHQSLMDANILAPSSTTGEAFSVPAFYAAVIAKVNDLINHL